MKIDWTSVVLSELLKAIRYSSHDTRSVFSDEYDNSMLSNTTKNLFL